MDLFLVTISVVEVFEKLGLFGGFVAFRVLRVLRTLRLARVMKFLKLMSYMQQIRRIFLLLGASMSMLGWSLVAVLSIMLLFAVIFTQGATDYLRTLTDIERTPRQDMLQMDFGSILKSVFSLYTAISGGRNWGTFTDELNEVSVVYVLIFIFFVLLCVLQLLRCPQHRHKRIR